MSQHPSRRRRSPILIIAGGVSALALAFAVSPAGAAMTAAITNDTNTAATGYLTMQEADSTGAVQCNSTDGGSVNSNVATCSTINKYGGSTTMAPGDTATTDVTIKNTGTVPATGFSLTPGACTQSAVGSQSGSATDLCSKATVVVTSGTTPVYSGTLADFATGGLVDLATAGLAPVAPDGSVPFTFALTMPSTLDGTYSGLQVSQPLTWTFNS